MTWAAACQLSPDDNTATFQQVTAESSRRRDDHRLDQRGDSRRPGLIDRRHAAQHAVVLTDLLTRSSGTCETTRNTRDRYSGVGPASRPAHRRDILPGHRLPQPRRRQQQPEPHLAGPRPASTRLPGASSQRGSFTGWCRLPDNELNPFSSVILRRTCAKSRKGGWPDWPSPPAGAGG
jgi:hypothetical protein